MRPRSRRLSAASLHVLISLLEGEKHGYAIMRDIEALTEGGVRMGPGTLYGTINRLVSDGLIEEVAARPDPALDEERRRYYRLTSEGHRVTAAELSQLRRLLQRVQRLHPDFGGATT